MRISKKRAPDPATQWALDVIGGRIVAGEHVRAACQRHLDDLEHGHKRGLVWKPEKAQRAINFFPACLTVTAGAAEGQPFELLPWHVFCVGSLFGWDKESGRLRFRRAWLETGKGQAKALALDTPIPTPAGWTTMGEIKTGDTVFDESGKVCRVTLAHEVLTDRKCYRLTFDDGETIVADAGHLWQTEMRKSGSSNHGDAMRGVPRSERGRWKHGIRTTAEIAASLRSANHSIALAGDRKVVECERVDTVSVRCISVDSPSRMFLCGRSMIPTHNSPLMAAIGLYMLGFYGVQRAEVYAIGQDRNVANVLFRDAVAMCRAPIPGGDESDTLEARGEVVLRGTLDNTWKIEHPATGSKFQAIANGKAISGPRPVAVLADEIHEFSDEGPLETWQRAITKLPGDAFMLLGTNTPASTQIVGTNYSEFFQKVAKGDVDDDEAFAFIARVDKADRETVFENEDCWQKALPALDVTFPRENIRGEVKTARVLLSTAMSVKRLYFGIPTGAVDFWIDEEAWATVQGVVDPDEMRGLPCWLSLDLSQKNDLTALSAIWKDEDGHLFAKTWYWTTQAGLEDRAKRDSAPYPRWWQEGHLEAVPGPVIDKTFVAAKVAELEAEHDIQCLAFDVAGIGDFIAACDEIGLQVWRYEGPDKPEGRGLKLMSHAQGTRIIFEDRQLCMPRSVERLEDAILHKTITIDNSPVTYSCAANAALVIDGQKNRAFDKKRSRGRIDGLVTLAMATGAATVSIESKLKFITGRITVL